MVIDSISCIRSSIKHFVFHQKLFNDRQRFSVLCIRFGSTVSTVFEFFIVSGNNRVTRWHTSFSPRLNASTQVNMCRNTTSPPLTGIQMCATIASACNFFLAFRTQNQDTSHGLKCNNNNRARPRRIREIPSQHNYPLSTHHSLRSE